MAEKLGRARDERARRLMTRTLDGPDDHPGDARRQAGPELGEVPRLAREHDSLDAVALDQGGEALRHGLEVPIAMLLHVPPIP